MKCEDVSIAVICPLSIEVGAMLQMLDEEFGLRQFPRDPNLYHLGRIGEHNIVIAGLPEGVTGIASTTAVASTLWFTFPAVKALILVGIGGGVPTTENDLRLGDIVVSRPDGKYGGVVQYDFGKSLSENRFEHTGVQNSPPRELLIVLGALKAKYYAKGTQIPDYILYLQNSQSNPTFTYAGAEKDMLFQSSYVHAGGNDCTNCDKEKEIKRKPRKGFGPVVHYGTIASANQLMRDSEKRDTYNRDYDSRILCFEMEAAGLMNSTPCLVIRGISDYADSHKRKDHAWHGYAAAAAAAFAKEFINTIPGDGLRNVATVAEDLARKGGLATNTFSPSQPNNDLPLEIFRTLGSDSSYIAPSDHFFGHLSMKSLLIYRRIWDQLGKDATGNLLLLSTVELFYAIENSHSWRAKVNSCQYILQQNFPQFNRNITLAFIYLLHMASTIGLGNLANKPFSIERVEAIARFDCWVICSCGCGSKWNYVRDNGLFVDDEAIRYCVVAKWLDRREKGGLMSMFHIRRDVGGRLYKNDLLKFLEIPI